ncbi:MAG: DeoR family transcriptional regulator, partial [Lachnospiraceae bacterium]|nr:DeoR family transcriptional regulator [Lachnospiraceae bacterium]
MKPHRQNRTKFGGAEKRICFSCQRLLLSAKVCTARHAFQRRRDIERMLLSGKKLTTSQMMKMFGVGKNAIRRDFDIIGEELPVVARQGYDGGYVLADGVGQHQNSLTQEQLECLEKVAVTCGSEDRKIVLSIIHEFGPYCESFT